MMNDTFIGWFSFYVLEFLLLLFILYEAALQGFMGNAVQHRIKYGKVNKERDWHILKCIAFAHSGKFKAEMFENDEYIRFIDVNSNSMYVTYVNDIEHSSFGNIGRRDGDSDYYYIPTFNTGNISYSTKVELLNLKHELLGTKPESTKSFWGRIFDKNEVTLQ